MTVKPSRAMATDLGRNDEEDHPEDQVGLPEMAAEEAAPPFETLGPVQDPDDRETEQGDGDRSRSKRRGRSSRGSSRPARDGCRRSGSSVRDAWACSGSG